MFYMNMLREQDELMGNTGFDPDMVVNSDDKYAIDLKDIAQAVEDINDEYAEESEQEELDGQDLHEDPVAESMIAIYENEHNWNMILQAIGTQELMEAARGRELVMEAADINSFIERAKEFFVKMFAKVTETVKNFLQKHSVLVRTNKAFAKHYAKAIRNGEAEYEKLVSDGKKKALRGYDFTDMDKHVSAFNTHATSVEDKVSNLKYATIDNFSDAEKIDTANIRKDLVGHTSAIDDAKGFAKICNAYFIGKEGVLTGTQKSAANVVSILDSGVTEMQNVKNTYAGIKKGYNDIIKSLNKLKDSISKAEKKGDTMKSLNEYIAGAKDAKGAVHTAFAAMMKAMHIRQSQALRIAHAYAAVGGADHAEKKAAKKETTKTESAGFFGSLELL